MALQRSPPNKFSSDSNIVSSVDSEHNTFINTRKRKQPDCEDMASFEEKFNKKLLTWDAKITESIAIAVSSSVSKEMTKISDVLSEININMMKLSADNVNINISLKETNTRLSELEKSLNFSAERQDSFDNRLKTVEDKMTSSADQVSQIKSLEHKISAMEQNARQCNIEICNLPERRNENLVSIVEKLGDVIACPVRASDIVAVHRVPHADPKNNRPKNVIVKLNNRMLRDNVISAYRSAKGLDSTKLCITGPTSTIYVNEHLTINNKVLFRQTREMAKKQAFRYVWVKHGTILARKSDTSPVIAIRSTEDIAKIK
ncbi:hypothetical protein ABMA27_002781 [Loxostege sticticalis]|uniref:FP protein C-terminal domain-containing protein n=1 Tax=Loxostege sticticalis TaxID=481309 RepID=A0ABR3HUU4_LOXSC